MSVTANKEAAVEVFLKKVFAGGDWESFSKLCKDGCSSEHLASLLFEVSSRSVSNGRERLLDTSGVSPKELKHFGRDLISIAGLLRRVNKTILNPKFDLQLAPPDVTRDAVREMCARLYDMLPGLMQVYSVHFERFSRFAEANLRQMTFAHFYALKFLIHVHENTGSPHYDDSANLLTAGFLVAGGSEDDLPNFFSAEALAKLNQRNKSLRY